MQKLSDILFLCNRKHLLLIAIFLTFPIVANNDYGLADALLANSYEAVQEALHDGASVTHAYPIGNALILAVGMKKIKYDIIKLMLDRGGKRIVNEQNRFGDTALIYAVWSDREDLVKLLLTYGANPLLTNGYDHTPLMYVPNNSAIQHILQDAELAQKTQSNTHIIAIKKDNHPSLRTKLPLREICKNLVYLMREIQK